MSGLNLVFTKHGERLEVTRSSTLRVTLPGCPSVSSLNDIAHILTPHIPAEWQSRISSLYASELAYRTERLALYREYQAAFPAIFQPLANNIVTSHPELFI